MTLYLVRHAHAGSRSDWDGADVDRPLSEKGRHQTDALTAHLAGVELDRVLASPAVRCRQTVEPLALERDLRVEAAPALAEGTGATPTIALLRQLASEGVDAALSSHGDVIPAALEALRADGVAVDDRRGLPKGTYYRLTVGADGAITAATFVDPRP